MNYQEVPKTPRIQESKIPNFQSFKFFKFAKFQSFSISKCPSSKLATFQTRSFQRFKRWSAQFSKCSIFEILRFTRILSFKNRLGFTRINFSHLVHSESRIMDLWAARSHKSPQFPNTPMISRKLY